MKSGQRLSKVTWCKADVDSDCRRERDCRLSNLSPGYSGPLNKSDFSSRTANLNYVSELWNLLKFGKQKIKILLYIIMTEYGRGIYAGEVNNCAQCITLWKSSLIVNFSW